MSEYRVSQICPKCNNTTYKKVRPKSWVAFLDERVCLECGERYTPPTPRWASILFILIGVFFIAPLPLGIGIDLLSGRTPLLASWGCYGLLATLGLAAVAHGV